MTRQFLFYSDISDNFLYIMTSFWTATGQLRWISHFHKVQGRVSAPLSFVIPGENYEAQIVAIRISTELLNQELDLNQKLCDVVIFGEAGSVLETLKKISNTTSRGN